MSDLNISNIVLFGVESVFSFAGAEERSTPEQMLEHLAKSLGEKFGLRTAVEVICRPFYWGLVYPGDKPSNEQPFFLRSEPVPGNLKKCVTYLALKEGVDLSDSYEVAYTTHAIIKKYEETLRARMQKANIPVQAA